MTSVDTNSKIKAQELKQATILFAGDSGDGMQITGGQFADTAAIFGNDVQIAPDYPAEIRAPQGTIAGVSGFQLQFASNQVLTPGDLVDVLVAMNPAALKANLSLLKPSGILLINEDKLTAKDLAKAKYDNSPLTDGSLDQYKVYKLPITSLTLKALEEIDIGHAQAIKCKNMFALGVVYWLYNQTLDTTINWLENKFKTNPELITANIKALNAGFNYALTCELFLETYKVAASDNKSKGEYRQLSGNTALSLGAIAASFKAKTPLYVSGYPITPASTILQSFAKYRDYNVTTVQAEDEIAAICQVIGAAYGGNLALCCTSGPGFDLKSESLGLAVMAELPLVVIDVQRAGPSTGMPTKTEQSDLLAAMYNRHGECPLAILAPKNAEDCFYTMLEAFNIAVNFMTPVIVLSDASLANSAGAFKIPDLNDLPNIEIKYHDNAENFSPYQRDEKLKRPWVKPGTPKLEHQIGGLEKDELGDISYSPINHQKMINLREQKINNIADSYPKLEIIGEDVGDLLVIAWGGTYGSVKTAIDNLNQNGINVSYLHLRHLNPLPKDLKTILNNFHKVMIVELNSGQLSKIIRAEYLIPTIEVNKVAGKQFLVNELEDKIKQVLLK